jgi:hypothetical protein
LPLCPHEGNLREYGFSLEAIIYSNYEWKICGDPKVIGLILGMQSGYTKFCCFLCERDSRAKDKLYKIKDCLMIKLSSRGKCVRNQPLFKKNKILLPPLHINLGLMKSFVKAMNKRGKVIFIVAPCILKIHLLSHTNKCTNYIIYYLKSVLIIDIKTIS